MQGRTHSCHGGDVRGQVHPTAALRVNSAAAFGVANRCRFASLRWVVPRTFQIPQLAHRKYVVQHRGKCDLDSFGMKAWLSKRSVDSFLLKTHDDDHRMLEFRFENALLVWF